MGARFKYIDPETGRKTTWGDWSPERINHDLRRRYVGELPADAIGK